MKKILGRLSALVLICTTLALAIPKPVQAITVDTQIDTRPTYVLYVNRSLNCVTVFTPDAQGNLAPIRSMVCSCGKQGHGTPVGTYSTSDYYDWRLMIDGTYGRYAVRFNKHILFHSVPYTAKSPDSLEWDQYNLLGQSASLGCVRLNVADAKWIYENCKPGSVIIDPESPKRGWDPTDDHAANPWITQ
ncbi:MAG: L,D-transpeptidase [Lachnospiraceae bacterium]|nr:L,D-transpeptidase [Lachnospiraceae bacterium]